MPSRPASTTASLLGLVLVTALAVAALFALRAWNDRADGGAPTAAPLSSDSPTAPTSAPSEPTAPAVAVPSASASDYGAVRALLDSIEQRPRTGHDGYDRDLFGERWADVDRNGCDTRNDVLARDLHDVELRRDGCIVQSGVLDDPFTGTLVHFERGPVSSEAIQIDHVVALYDAWRTGAQELTFERRTELANDPANLLAVEGQANQDKGHADAATWLPPNEDFHCEYVAARVHVKASYGLWMTPAEHAASKRVLESCD